MSGGDKYTSNMELGQPIAELLFRSWIPTPTGPEVTEAVLDKVLRRLLASGAAPLAWRQVAGSAVGSTPSGQELHNAFRFYRLEAAKWDARIRVAVSFFHDLNVRSIFFKGWTVARWYPERGLRPFSDLDVAVGPADYGRVREAFAAGRCPDAAIDLHANLGDLGDLSFEDVWAQTVRVPVDSVAGLDARVLGFEDHLRLLAVHMMRHGAHRPGWLCDIAIGLERAGADFDWERFFGGEPERSWMLGVVGLAECALGARIGHCPYAERARDLPRWLHPSLIWQWGRPHYLEDDPVPRRLSAWKEVAASALKRWPNPIQATVRRGRRFDESPRLPYQFHEFFSRGMRFIRKGT